MEKYEPVLKEYKDWNLILSAKQYPYVGRCKAWSKRRDANEVIEMTKGERDELFDQVLPEWSKAVKTLFNPYRLNLAVFGNTVPHLHVHLIPRYQDEKDFYGETFHDPNPTGNYAPYPKKDLDVSILKQIELDFVSTLKTS